MKAQPPVLPAELVGALTIVGARLRQGEDAAAELDAALARLAGLDPSRVADADAKIAEAAGLNYHWRAPQPGEASPRAREAELLLRLPALAYLFVFHRDGRLREAALLKITGGLPDPFLFAAVAWRLNDWAEPVRRAAVRCAERSFPATDPTVVARAAAALLVRQASWGRWQGERAILDRVFGRDDVAARLADLIAREPTGPQASALRYALRLPALDRHLDRIARAAVQPAVRAVALTALIDGVAEWPSGWAFQWIDKAWGLQHRVTTFDRRPLAVAVSREALIALGIADRSAMVRRAALTAVIRHLAGTPAARAFAAPLAADPSPSVRERAQYILRTSAA